MYIYLFITFYLPLKYRTIDGPMAVVNCRNMKLFLNKGSCVLTDSKWYVFKHCTNTTGCTAFNVLNILKGIGYIKEWWPHIIRIIYTFWNFNSQNAYSLSKAWLHRPPTSSIHHNFSEPLTDSLLLPGTCSNFFFTTVDFHNIIQSRLWFPPTASNIFLTSCQQPAFSASCRQ